jgi:hypothetical protein
MDVKLCLSYWVYYIQDDSELLSGFKWRIIFQIRNNKIKLLMEYETLIQNGSLAKESMVQNAK